MSLTGGGVPGGASRPPAGGRGGTAPAPRLDTVLRRNSALGGGEEGPSTPEGNGLRMPSPVPPSAPCIIMFWADLDRSMRDEDSVYGRGHKHKGGGEIFFFPLFLTPSS